jgi:hypothetical protein
MSGNINANNITSTNITVTNLTVTNINGRPYSGAGGCGSYYTSCPGCDGDPDADPCDGIHDCGDDPDIDPCDCLVVNNCGGGGGSGATGAQGYQGATGRDGSAGGNGGLPLYLNYSEMGIPYPPSGTTSLVSPIINSGGGIDVSYNLVSTGTFQTFISNNELQVTSGTIPQGVYTLYLYAYVSAGSIDVEFKISKYNIISFLTTPIVAGSPTVTINNTGNIQLYTILAPGLSTTFNYTNGDRILVELVNDTFGNTLFVDYEFLTGGNGYSYIQTTLIPQGPTGAQGSQGETGAIGATGTTGAQGFQGSIGTTGSTGAIGATGSTGAQGFQGRTGATGAQGFQGFTGATGAQGFQGFTGATGSQGFQGNTGATGAQGFQGFTGSTGAIGATGSTGAQGFQGFTGTTGAQGYQGNTGPGQPNFYTNYTIIQITGPTGFNIPASSSSPDYYNIYEVDTTNGEITINLPSIASLDNNGKRIHSIVDSAGELSNNNLIIIPTPSDTISGQSSATISVDYSSVQIMSNTVDKWLII